MVAKWRAEGRGVENEDAFIFEGRDPVLVSLPVEGRREGQGEEGGLEAHAEHWKRHVEEVRGVISRWAIATQRKSRRAHAAGQGYCPRTIPPEVFSEEGVKLMKEGKVKWPTLEMVPRMLGYACANYVFSLLPRDMWEAAPSFMLLFRFDVRANVAVARFVKAVHRDAYLSEASGASGAVRNLRDVSDVRYEVLLFKRHGRVYFHASGHPFGIAAAVGVKEENLVAMANQCLATVPSQAKAGDKRRNYSIITGGALNTLRYILPAGYSEGVPLSWVLEARPWKLELKHEDFGVRMEDVERVRDVEKRHGAQAGGEGK